MTRGVRCGFTFIVVNFALQTSTLVRVRRFSTLAKNQHPNNKNKKKTVENVISKAYPHAATRLPASVLVWS